MKIAILFTLILSMSVAAFSQATHVYVTPAGTALGNCPSGTASAPNLTASGFSNSANWGTGTGQIGPGTIVLGCGTFTGSTGATVLAFQGSGTSGSKITLISDTASPMIIQAPYFAGSGGGGIYAGSFSHLVIDGAGTGNAAGGTFVTNGLIKTTANGSGLANQQASFGINVAGADVTIQNWEIGPMYVRIAPIAVTSTLVTGSTYNAHCTAVNCNFANGLDIDVGCSTNDGNQTSSSANTFVDTTHFTYTGQGSGGTTDTTCSASDVQPGLGSNVGINALGATQVQAINNKIHDATNGWVGGLDTTIIGPNNEIYNEGHSIQTAAISTTIEGNHIHDWGNWSSACSSGTGCPSFHNDGLHCYAGTTGPVTSMIIYNNQFDGSPSAIGQQGFIYLEGNSSSTKCMAAGGTAYVFNNVALYSTASINVPFGIYGNQTTGDVNDIFANNTLVGWSPTSGSQGVAFQNTPSISVENNAMGGNGIVVADLNGALGIAPNYTIFDYDAWENCSTTNCFSAAGVNSGSFTSWQAGKCVGGVSNTCDQHGIANMSSSTYFNLNSSGVPLAGSPLITAGKNLYSICNGQPNPGLGALCSDKNGVARPSSGAWDIGAYQYVPIPGSTILGGISILDGPVLK